MTIERLSQVMVLALSATLFGAALRAQETPRADGGRIAVRVDPRVELMSAIFRLAGNPEYDQPASASPYAAALSARLEPHRDHPVIAAARRLRARRGVSYDAVMSLAVHVEDVATLAELIPFDEQPERLDARWLVDEAREFLVQARDFVKKTGFLEFVAGRAAFYEVVAARMQAKLAERSYVPWFDGFFGARPKATFVVIPGLLNGGACYGVGTRFADGTELITPVIGCWTWDEEGLPVFEDGFVPTVVHELCHSYTNALVDQFAAELRPAGERIFAHCREVMAKQAYGNWKTVLYESLVRASVVRYLADTDGTAIALEQIGRDEARGFLWIGPLVTALDAYAADRETYPDFAAFMPRVVAFFEGFADEYDALVKQAPQLVSLAPANGDREVDPNTTSMVIVFDRPMRAGGWSIWGDPEDMPEFAGSPSYGPDRRTLTIPIRLAPDREYRFSLNSSASQNFRSEQGTPLAPTPVSFRTRSGS